MPKAILVLNDDFRGYVQNWDLGGDWEAQSYSMPRSGVPSIDWIAQHNTVAVVGRIQSVDRADELAGGLRLAVEDGVTAIVLCPLRLEAADLRLVESLAPTLTDIEYFSTGRPMVARDKAFHRFFSAYGRASSDFTTIPDDSNILGTVDDKPAAVSMAIGRGTLYVIPFHVAALQASHNSLIRSALEAIQAYESGGDSELPQFVEEMRLPGEQNALDRIATLHTEVAEAELEVEKLKTYRQIIGRASGERLEELVIDVFNQVLAETKYDAEDRPDVKAEDFWLVESGKNNALVEVKGIGGSVNRQAVNQVDNHRAEHDLAVEDMPGILVVNAFRNSTDPVQRELPVPPDVIKHAVRLNVLVLRTRDLYFLLHQALGDRNAGQKLCEAVEAGGGWLEVSENAVNLRV